MYLRFPFFWDLTLRHWLYTLSHSTFILNCQILLFRWRRCFSLKRQEMFTQWRTAIFQTEGILLEWLDWSILLCLKVSCLRISRHNIGSLRMFQCPRQTEVFPTSHSFPRHRLYKPYGVVTAVPWGLAASPVVYPRILAPSLLSCTSQAVKTHPCLVRALTF